MIENLKHWKISSITALITDDSVQLLDTKIVSQVSKGFSGSRKTELAGEVEAKLEFSFGHLDQYRESTWEETTGIKILVKSAEFPDPDKWYGLRNFYSRHLGRILKQCKFDETGKFSEVFSPVVSPSSELTLFVSLCSDNMEEYDTYLEETIREMNCEVNKKTKRWIPGHRYDSLSETRYPICKIPIRENIGEEFPVIPDKEVWIYTNKIGDEKSISEILSTRTFGKDIHDLKIMTTVPSGFVESGEVIVNDINIKDGYDKYLREIIKNSRDKLLTKKILENNQNIYYYLLPYFAIDDIEQVDKDNLKEFINFICERCLYKYWDNNYIWFSYKKLSSSQSLPENVDSLSNYIFNNIPDKNRDKIAFYTSMFNTYGIDVTKFCTEIITAWNPNKFLENLDTYLNNINYFRSRHYATDYTVDIRTKSSVIKNRNQGENTKVPADIIGNGILNDIIEDMKSQGQYTKTKDLGIENYSYLETIISIEDVLKYATEKYGEIPEDLKCEILRHQFCFIHLMHDK